MNASDIITLARDLTQSTSNQLSDAQAVKFANIVYHDIESRIVWDVGEDYFWESFVADTVVWQNEYPLPESTSIQRGIKKVKSVEVKYSSNDSYNTLVESDTISNFDTSEWYLKDNQSIAGAFYDVRDGSVFLYPKTTEVVSGGYKVSWPATLIDLTSITSETDIFPNASEMRQFHYIIAIGMKQYINSFKWKDNLVPSNIQEYELKVSNMIEYLNNRSNSSVEWELPSNTNLTT